MAAIASVSCGKSKVLTRFRSVTEWQDPEHICWKCAAPDSAFAVVPPDVELDEDPLVDDELEVDDDPDGGTGTTGVLPELEDEELVEPAPVPLPELDEAPPELEELAEPCVPSTRSLAPQAVNAARPLTINTLTICAYHFIATSPCPIGAALTRPTALFKTPELFNLMGYTSKPEGGAQANRPGSSALVAVATYFE